MYGQTAADLFSSLQPGDVGDHDPRREANPVQNKNTISVGSIHTRIRLYKTPKPVKLPEMTTNSQTANPIFHPFLGDFAKVFSSTKNGLALALLATRLQRSRPGWSRCCWKVTGGAGITITETKMTQTKHVSHPTQPVAF